MKLALRGWAAATRWPPNRSFRTLNTQVPASTRVSVDADPTEGGVRCRMTPIVSADAVCKVDGSDVPQFWRICVCDETAWCLEASVPSYSRT